jgi:hypothetical protein
MTDDDLGPELRRQLEEVERQALDAAPGDLLARAHALQIELRQPITDGPLAGLTYDQVVALWGDEYPDARAILRARERIDLAVTELGGTWSDELLDAEAREGWE